MGATSAATVGGLVVGLLLSIGAGQALRGLLYGMSPLDPWSYAGVIGVLALCGVAAAFLPMRRAAHVDPVLALRAE